MKPARFSLKNEIPQSGVLIVDSGAGALNFLGEIRQLLPDSSLIALADHAEFPYGDKSDEQIIERLLELTERCIELFSPSTLVIACWESLFPCDFRY
ncbi:MAG: hypothetical protein HRT88_24180 [Lentisphaeraceae bacterium]|nr:hypothetical protein [Lentisphaeraceae bacterium]